MEQLDAGKDDFLAELAQMCRNSKEPYIVGGDLNIIRSIQEKNKGGNVHRHTNSFNAIIDAYELREITMTGGKYTWSNNQPDPILEKLDRMLMSKEWEDIFPGVVINKLPREISEHNSLILHTELNQPLRHLEFRFEIAWFNQPEFMEKVAEIWNKACFANTALDRIK